jgi:hypothetical protein
MKVGEFQRELGVSGPAYNRFMNRTGTWDGEGTDTYFEAVKFFKKREFAGLPLQAPKAKRPKTSAAMKTNASGQTKSTVSEAQLDTGCVKLEGEEQCTVPIYMTCNDVRKALRALIAKGVTQAALCRALSKQYPEGSGQGVSAANLRYFMGQTGIDSGCGSTAFYAGYCLLEKLRIHAGKPKSKFREEMEKAHGKGGITESNRYVTVLAGETPALDKYGCLHFGP